MQLIHHSPLGALEIPGVLGRPKPGEPFDIDDDLGKSLLKQSELYTVPPSGELSIPELRALAKERGVDIKGLRSKDDIAAAIAAHHDTAAPPPQDADADPAQESAQQDAAADDTKESDQ